MKRESELDRAEGKAELSRLITWGCITAVGMLVMLQQGGAVLTPITLKMRAHRGHSLMRTDPGEELPVTAPRNL